MSTDNYHEIDQLNKDYESQWAHKKAEFEQEIQAKLGEAKANQTTPLTKEQMKSVEQNIRNQMKPQMDQIKDLLAKRMFENYGGSQAEALKLRDKERQVQDQQREQTRKTQELNTQSQQEQQNAQNEKMTQKLREDKEREEKKQKEKEQQEQQRQEQARNAEEQKKELERQRIREQFNQVSRNDGRGK
ncbi:hypothetical protein [uncultured Roseivirga sp.]|uniref:hypothetical protein n=1 Tax=uncultured Roseivirga sp. TaxID=543088 RepID=UPI0030D81EAC|tara:strand:+ start:242 stop:805 length:564 start_codon:yes stop_codon:yes gene_type:complete